MFSLVNQSQYSDVESFGFNLGVSLGGFLFLPHFHDDCWQECCQGDGGTPAHVAPAENVPNLES